MAKAAKTPVKKSGSFKKEVKDIVKPRKKKVKDEIPVAFQRIVKGEIITGYITHKGVLTKVGADGNHYIAATNKKVVVKA